MSERSSISKETQPKQTTQAPDIKGDAQDSANLSALGEQSISFTNADLDNVLRLQRTLGNQATMQLMGKSHNKINRTLNLRMAGAIQREGDDEGIVEEQAHDHDNSSLEGLPEVDSSARREEDNTEPAPPKLSDPSALNVMNDRDRVKFINRFINNDDPRKIQPRFLHRVWYQARRVRNDPNDPFNKPEFRAKVESADWSWMLEATSVEELKTLHQMRNAYLNQEDIDKSPWEQFKKGTQGTASVASAGFTVLEGVETIKKIADNNDGGTDAFGSVMENVILWIMGKIFAGVAIGFDLIKAFGYHKKRRDGYKAALDRAGIDEETDLSELEPGTMSEDKLAVAEVAQYAYKKTSRAYSYTIAKIITKLVKWIMYAITMTTGGATAAVTGTLAIGADIVRVSAASALKLKGAIKALMGTKGQARAQNADVLVKQASKGSEEAMRVIYDVDPFDHIKAVQTYVGVKREKLPKPETFEIFVDEWDPKKNKRLANNGYSNRRRVGIYSKPEVRAALSSALKETMKSQ